MRKLAKKRKQKDNFKTFLHILLHLEVSKQSDSGGVKTGAEHRGAIVHESLWISFSTRQDKLIMFWKVQFHTAQLF